MDNKNKLCLDLSIISMESRLLLEIIMKEYDDILWSVNNEMFLGVDWDLFLELAIHHRVYPLIFTKLNNFDKKLIPHHVILTLSKEYKKNTFQMLHLSGEMEQVSKLFAENQIRLLFLKGPVIAADIYGDISLRTSKDLDILIPKSDIKKAEELLLNYGYEKEEVQDIFGEWKWRNHHVTYFHPQKRIQIEIHWRLHPRPTKEPSFIELWERKRVSKLTSYPVFFLGKEDLFLFLVSHGARHGWFRLRWLVDIDQIVRKSRNFEKSILSNYYQNNLLVGQALILASQLLKTPIIKEINILKLSYRSRKLAQLAVFYIKEKGFEDIKKPQKAFDKYNHSLFSLKSNLRRSFYLNLYQFSVKSNLQKFYYIIELFHPSSADVETLILPRYLHFLYFPLRPFLWAWRKTRKIV
ncbi:nucleotidyltransferase family protein [Bacillus sp. ISL-4]|uniref:nucleotidyltransferase domain-containing protein n=1 Tax=Bacillus sp. ISL-4 TaxID=2819125 RepID=UPI001BEB9745|nr:nucleotidyltransferase family protein [Bacillus sp. ISL-4]MBT2667485.1 nucleotidyltransferase family protein [Bacillus sp. ISL-4]MBT2672976.1 nucleotidyltransferase family protein [Streptomyces sp. ISL-14]